MKKYKAYLTYFEWSATCEGLTYEFAISAGRNPREAKLNHIKKLRPHVLEFKNSNPESFIGIVSAYPFKIGNKRNPKVEEILKRFLTPEMIEHTLRANDGHALIQMSFVHYVNFS